VRLSALRAGCPLPPPPPKDSWYSFLLKGWVDTRAMVRLEGLNKLKKNPRHRDSIPRPAL
jgi:hypothetical protein